MISKKKNFAVITLFMFFTLAMTATTLLMDGINSPANSSSLSKTSTVHEDHNGHEDEDHSRHTEDEKHADPAVHTEDDEHEDHDMHAEDKEHENHDDHAENEEHVDSNDAGHTDYGHEEEGDENDHEGENLVRLNAAELEEFNIEIARAEPGSLDVYVELPGELVINTDRQAHVVPRVPGIVREVYKKLGDTVKKDEVMAVIESRVLADTKAGFMAARERFDMAQLNFSREKSLWNKKISSEQEYFNARQVLVEARIELRSTEQKLYTLGFSEDYLKKLPENPDSTFTRYEIRAPFTGTIIQKHITLGEALKDDSEAFIVADLKTVWVDISVYQKDLALIRVGQKTLIEFGQTIPDVEGKISYVGPLVGESTRTTLARVILPNPDGKLRPGMFITARVATESSSVRLRTTKSALQNLDNKTVVFVKTSEGFLPHPVKVGRSNASFVEIISGLEKGAYYASQGAFTLKAQISKGGFDDGHNH